MLDARTLSYDAAQIEEQNYTSRSSKRNDDDDDDDDDDACEMNVEYFMKQCDAV
jgi:hypothetical protein